MSPFSRVDHTCNVPDYPDELAQIVAELNRAAPTRESSPKPRAKASAVLRPPANSSSLDQLLALAVRRAASDLLLIAGAPVTLRIAGSLTAAGPPLGAEEARNLLLPLLSQVQSRELERAKSVDLCFSREGIGRFRANVHHQRGSSRRQHPSASRKGSDARIAAPASDDCAEVRRCPPGARADHRTHRLRQELDPGRADRPDQHQSARSRGDHRRSHRIRARKPAVGDRADRDRPGRAGFRRVAAQHSASESGRDPGGGNARSRNHRHGADGGRDGPPGALDAAHQRHVAGGLAHPRFVPVEQPAADPPAAIAGACWRWWRSNWSLPPVARVIRRSKSSWRPRECGI